MNHLILELKSIKTMDKVSINIDEELPFDRDAFVPTSVGLYFLQENGDFTDILEINKIKRKENGSWNDYYIDSYTYADKKYRYKRNRNLYNKKDKSIVVKVGECSDEGW